VLYRGLEDSSNYCKGLLQYSTRIGTCRSLVKSNSHGTTKSERRQRGTVKRNKELARVGSRLSAAVKSQHRAKRKQARSKQAKRSECEDSTRSSTNLERLLYMDKCLLASLLSKTNERILSTGIIRKRKERMEALTISSPGLRF
jgi:hypothetical protein